MEGGGVIGFRVSTTLSHGRGSGLVGSVTGPSSPLSIYLDYCFLAEICIAKFEFSSSSILKR